MRYSVDVTVLVTGVSERQLQASATLDDDCAGFRSLRQARAVGDTFGAFGLRLGMFAGASVT